MSQKSILPYLTADSLDGDNDPKSPAFMSDNVKCQLPELQFVRAIQNGFPAYTDLLIQHMGEKQNAFNERKRYPCLFDEMTPNVRELIGKLLQTDPELEVTSNITNLLDNVDNRGTDFTSFLALLFGDAIWAGHSFVLVDYVTAENAQTKADELELGARPYWVWIKKDQVRNFGTTIVNGIVKLQWISILESIDQPNGFAAIATPQLRVLRRGAEGATYQLYQQDKRDKWVPTTPETQFLGSNQKTFDDIPLVPIYSRQTGFLESRPLNIELGQMVQMKYNITNDQIHNHAITCYPTAKFKNMTAKQVENTQLGGINAVCLPGKDTDFSYESGQATGVELADKILERFSLQGVVLGTRLFETQKPDRVTATAKTLDDEIDTNVAVQLANVFESSIEQVFDYTEYYLSDNDGGTITLAPNQEPEQEVSLGGAPNASMSGSSVTQ